MTSSNGDTEEGGVGEYWDVCPLCGKNIEEERPHLHLTECEWNEWQYDHPSYELMNRGLYEEEEPEEEDIPTPSVDYVRLEPGTKDVNPRERPAKPVSK